MIRTCLWTISVLAIVAAMSTTATCHSEEQASAAPSSTSRELIAERQEQLVSAVRKAKLLDDKSGDWPYFSNEALQSIAKRGALDMPLTEALLLDPGTSEEVKVLAARLLPCLSVSQYVDLLKLVWGRGAKGRISAPVLRALILPGAEWSTVLSLSHAKPEVREVLEQIEADPRSTQEVREAIQSVLSGEEAEFINAYNSPASPLPRWSCKRQVQIDQNIEILRRRVG